MSSGKGSVDLRIRASPPGKGEVQGEGIEVPRG